ncbi:FHA domain-containing protein [Variovorax saccharolyticus]|uniref:FHA domain-containing protein n=1 Tax=Variovorax saccharolyticus TaxID=3053516 RepID=UPI0025791890|nr:FHA domain-containing protein [Variovorax sp. J31P216]MDM0030172.1 FHA domain-containing protein [Variovorax sp. J31P216]
MSIPPLHGADDGASFAELRILGGLQSGARLAVSPGTYTLGAANSCDLILIGHQVADHAASISVTERGWRLDEEGQRGSELPFGTSVSIGDVVLTVERADAPWAQREAAAPLAPLAQPAAGAVETGVIVSDRRRWPGISARRLKQGAALVLGLALTGGAIGLIRTTGRSLAQESPVLSAVSVETLNAMLASLGAQAGVEVRREGDGRFAMQGYVADAKTLQRLRKAVSQLKANVQFEVQADAVIREQVLLATGELLAPDELEVENGVIRIRAGAPVSGERIGTALKDLGITFRALTVASSAPQAALAAASPPPTPLASAVRNQAYQRMEQMLADAGLAGKARLSWQGASLRVEGQLSAAEIAMAHAVLSRFLRATDGAVQFIADFKPLTANRLPFRIVQVVGGANPYVITDSRERLYVGGEYRGYRLVAATDGKLVFDGLNAVELKW